MVSLPEASTAYKTVQWLFYMHSAAKHEEQNILILKLVRLCLKCKVSSKQLLQMSSRKSNLHLGIKPTLYLLAYVENA
jgi:hypothetical protein